MTIVSQQRIKPLMVTPQEDPKAYVESLLEQINKVLIPTLDHNSKRVEMAFQPVASVQKLKATDRIEHTVSVMPVEGFNSAITLTSVPTISKGYNGEIITLIGMDGTKTLKLQDSSNLTGSLLNLAGGADVTLGAGDTLQLMYNSTLEGWYQISGEDN